MTLLKTNEQQIQHLDDDIFTYLKTAKDREINNYTPFPSPEEHHLLKCQEKLKSMFKDLSKALQNGDLATLMRLESQAPWSTKQMIEMNNFYAYRQAATNGHLNILKHLESLQYVEVVIRSIFPMQHDYDKTLSCVESQRPQYIKAMIVADNFYAYRQAAKNGHLEVLKHLESKAPSLIKKMIKAVNFYAYRQAAKNDHLEVLKHLESQEPSLIKEMIAADNFYAYRQAAKNDHLEVLKHLESKAPSLIKKMIKAVNFYAYRQAAENGHLEVLKHLESQEPSLIKKMIKAVNFFCDDSDFDSGNSCCASSSFYTYHQAAKNGHLEVLKHLESQAPSLIKKMIEADNFYAYRQAATDGHLDILQHLESQAPSLIKKMIEADNFYAYRQAAKNGHLEVLKYLDSRTPWDIKVRYSIHDNNNKKVNAFFGELKSLSIYPPTDAKNEFFGRDCLFFARSSKEGSKSDASDKEIQEVKTKYKY